MAVKRSAAAAQSASTTFDYGFFDSTSATLTDSGFYKGNKAKDAAFFRRMLSAFIDSGVVMRDADSFAVKAYLGNPQWQPGAAFLKGAFCYDTETESYTVTASSAEQKIYAVLWFNSVTGEMGKRWETEPGEDFPKRTDTYWEIVPAVVTVPANVSVVTDDMITDLRLDSDWCGAITSTASVAALRVYVDNKFLSVAPDIAAGKAASEALESKDVTVMGYRKIYAGTADLTAGNSDLETGAIYCVYE